MIIHAVPKFIRSVPGAGNWKAVEAMRLTLSELGQPFETFDFADDNWDELIARCRAGARHVLIEYSFWPELVERIRREAPQVGIHVRTINAEPFQHYHRAHPGILPSYRNLKAYYGCLRLAWRDARCKRAADTLLGISEWDNEHYWRHLPGRAAVQYLPYYCPWPFLRPKTKPLRWQDREQAILCMPGARDRISECMISDFHVFAEACEKSAVGRQWDFLLTPGILAKPIPTDGPSPLRILQDSDDPWTLLCRVRAVAVLTPLGFGTKTTIVDALAAGCHVLVNPTLATRLSPPVKDLCIACSQNVLEHPKEILARISALPVPHDLNGRLRQSALAIVREGFSESTESDHATAIR